MRNPFRWTVTLTLVGLLALVACGNGEAGAGSEGQTATVNADAASSADAGSEAKADSEAGAAEADKPKRIAQGERVELTDHLAEGQITVFDFMSDYCPPCRRIAPFMDRLHREREDVTVVKVDINRPDVKGIDWRSPVAQQYRMNSIPAFKIYGADGQLMAEGQAASEMLNTWLQELVNSNG